jgi:hypothetical protein
MKLVNLTPHEIRLLIPGLSWEQPLVLKPRPETAHVNSRWMRTDATVNGLPVLKRIEEEKLAGLPKPKPETVYITSRLAAQAAWERGRTDVFYLFGARYDKGNRKKKQKPKLVGWKYLVGNPEAFTGVMELSKRERKRR